MPDDGGASKEIAEGLHSIFERLGEFFHLFDLSFFVSGATTFGALTVLYLRLDLPRAFPFASWVGALALVLACYVCGLMSFSAGRALNGRLFRRRLLETKLPASLAAHGLTVDGAYYENAAGALSLYERLWQDLTHYRPRSLALSHLSRYWVMAATYDGLGVSFLVWMFVALSSLVWPHAIVTIPRYGSVGAAVVFLSLAVLAFAQSAKFYHYQVEDIVAALAASRSKLREVVSA